jgi:hypothetical protein
MNPKFLALLNPRGSRCWIISHIKSSAGSVIRRAPVFAVVFPSIPGFRGFDPDSSGRAVAVSAGMHDQFCMGTSGIAALNQHFWAMLTTTGFDGIHGL